MEINLLKAYMIQRTILFLEKNIKKYMEEYPDFIIKKYEGKIKLEKTHSFLK